MECYCNYRWIHTNVKVSPLYSFTLSENSRISYLACQWRLECLENFPSQFWDLVHIGFFFIFKHPKGVSKSYEKPLCWDTFIFALVFIHLLFKGSGLYALYGIFLSYKWSWMNDVNVASLEMYHLYKNKITVSNCCSAGHGHGVVCVGTWVQLSCKRKNI